MKTKRDEDEKEAENEHGNENVNENGNGNGWQNEDGMEMWDRTMGSETKWKLENQRGI